MDASIDLETLGTDDDAVVLSAGMVLFNHTGIFSQHDYYVRLPLDEQLGKRSVTASTLEWWMLQPDEARSAVFGKDTNGHRCTIDQLWHDIDTMFRICDVQRVWARGTHFDLTILGSLFKQRGAPTPWKYNAPRDSRTILDVLPPELLPKRSGIAHHALDDARYEAQCIIAAQRYISHLQDSLAQQTETEFAPTF